MKIRQDFVTNSSSTSWIIFTSLLTAVGFIFGLAKGLAKSKIPDQGEEPGETGGPVKSEGEKTDEGLLILDGEDAKSWLRNHGLMAGNQFSNEFWNGMPLIGSPQSPLQGIAGSWDANDRNSQIGDISISILKEELTLPDAGSKEVLTREDLAAVVEAIGPLPAEDFRPMYGISPAPGQTALPEIRPMYGVSPAPGLPDSPDIKPMYGVSPAPGLPDSPDIKPMYGISPAPGQAELPEIKPMYGISPTPGQAVPPEIKPMYGISTTGHAGQGE